MKKEINKPLKKCTTWAWILAISIVVIFILSFNFSNGKFFFSKDDSNESINKITGTNNIPIVEIKDDFSNIGELHWTHMPITYKFENECSDRQINLTRLAFHNIEKETGSVIIFKEVSENPDISVYCLKDNGEKDANMILGDERYNLSQNNTNLITHSEIHFYGQGMVCNTGYPALEVHEILHAFGFMDDALLDRIMSGYSAETSRSCEIKSIDKESISCLRYVYSNGLVQGDCSKVLFRVCNKGYIVGSDNQCHKECGEGYIMYDNYQCYPDCGENYILGNDGVCHEMCGESYCLKSSTCCNSQCLTCPYGSSLGSDCLCH